MPSLEGAKMQAATYPADVRTQLLAATACHEAGDLPAAVKYYESAYRIGLPIDGKLRFYFGFASALRDVGRLDDSEEVLRKACKEYPYDKALPAQLALTLHKLGKHDEAMAEILELLVRLRDVVKDFAQHKPELLLHAAELRKKFAAADAAAAGAAPAPAP